MSVGTANMSEAIDRRVGLHFGCDVAILLSRMRRRGGLLRIYSGFSPGFSAGALESSRSVCSVILLAASSGRLGNSLRLLASREKTSSTRSGENIGADQAVLSGNRALLEDVDRTITKLEVTNL